MVSRPFAVSLSNAPAYWLLGELLTVAATSSCSVPATCRTC